MSALMVFAVVAVVLTIMTRVSIVSNAALGLTSTEAVNRAGERARSNFTIQSTIAGGDVLTLEVKNTGLTSVFDFAKIEFFVKYTDISDNDVFTRLEYTTGTLSDNEWKRTSIAPDNFEPNAWNPGEIIILDAKLVPAQKVNTTGSASVATPNGVSGNAYFTAQGFIWLTDATDISLTTTGSWQDIDLSAIVPVGTSGAIVEVVHTSLTDNLSGVLRGKPDTRDYMSNASFEEMRKETHRWQVVGVDGDRLIQGYIESTDIDFKLRGYTLGSDPWYCNYPGDILPPTTNSWGTVDVSGYVDPDADGVILLVDSLDSGDQKYGIREFGSSFTGQSDVGAYGNSMYLVGINSNGRFDAFIETTDVKIYLVGYTMGSVVYDLEDVPIADPANLDSWKELDADGDGVAVPANGLFLRVENTGGTHEKAGFRHGDSTDDWNGDVRGNHHIQAGTGIRADNVLDEYLENANLDVTVEAYTKPPAPAGPTATPSPTSTPEPVVSNVPVGFFDHTQNLVHFDGMYFYLFYEKNDNNIYWRYRSVSGTWSSEQTLVPTNREDGIGWNIWWEDDFTGVLVVGKISPRTLTFHKIAITGGPTITLSGAESATPGGVVVGDIVLTMAGDTVFGAYTRPKNTELFKRNATGYPDGTGTYTNHTQSGNASASDGVVLIPYSTAKVLVIRAVDPGGSNSDGWNSFTWDGSTIANDITMFLHAGSVGTNRGVAGVRVSDTDFRVLLASDGTSAGKLTEWKWDGSSGAWTTTVIDAVNVVYNKPSLMWDPLNGDFYAFAEAFAESNTPIYRYKNTGGSSWGTRTLVDNSESTARSSAVAQYSDPPPGSSRTCALQLVWAYRVRSGFNFDLTVGTLELARQ